MAGESTACVFTPTLAFIILGAGLFLKGHVIVKIRPVSVGFNPADTNAGWKIAVVRACRYTILMYWKAVLPSLHCSLFFDVVMEGPHVP